MDLMSLTEPCKCCTVCPGYKEMFEFRKATTCSCVNITLKSVWVEARGDVRAILDQILGIQCVNT